MPLKMKYFVLKPEPKSGKDPHALASQSALYAYADKIEKFDQNLAKDLRNWAKKSYDKLLDFWSEDKEKESNDLKISFKTAREIMSKELKEPGLHQSYKANIAMCIYDNRNIDSRLTVQDCNAIAEKLIELIFD